MSRTAIVHVLLFVAAIGVASMFVGTIVTEAGEYVQSIDAESDRLVAEIDAEIAIVNDPEAGTTYDETNETVTLYIKNVGGATLEPAAAEVTLDGEYVAAPSTRVLDADHDRWRVNRVLELELDAPVALDPGDHRAHVSIDGATDRLAFEHRIVRWLSPDERDGTADDCDENECTVYLNETTTLDLEIGTDQPQPDEPVTYASSNETVATVDPESGVTDGIGADTTTLDLHETGVTTVTVDAGWDDDEIVIVVEN